MKIEKGTYRNGNTVRVYERHRVGAKTVYSPSFYAKTEREAVKQFGAWVRKGGFDIPPAPAPTAEVETTGAYVQKWFDRQSGDWAVTTTETNKNRLVHITRDGTLCSIPLNAVTTPDVREWLARLAKAGQSVNNRANVLKLLGQALGAAVEDKKLGANPCAFKKGRPSLQKSKIKAFETDDAAKLVTYATGKPSEAIVRVLFTAGLRQSEAFALQWRCFDAKHQMLRIERTIATVNSGRRGVLVESTKTEGSHRVVHLSATTTEALKALKPRNAQPEDFVFTPSNGQAFWHRGTFRTYWKSLLKAAGVSYKGAHSARHSMASEMRRNGEDISAISARLGHASPTMTLNQYGHVTVKDQTELAERSDLFG